MRKPLLLLLLSALCLQLRAQFSLDGQIVQRSEYRNGFNRLIPAEEDPAFFIAHRVRLRAQYEMDKFHFYASIQDVRTWGSTPQAKATDPFLSLHQGWAQYDFHDNWSVRLGRQELNYDNARLIGNLDWALQARAHDFALVKYEKDDFKLHFGSGYNQDGQALTGNVFTIPNQYKTAQMLWMQKEGDNYKLAFMGWNDGRQFVNRDTMGGLTDKGQHFRTTLGLSTLRFTFGATTLSGFYYHQLGKDAAGRDLNAFDGSAQISQTLYSDTEKGSSFKAALGFEILSGTDTGGLGDDSNSFAPLYGTNHAHNGYMDYFYVGGRWNNSVGLQDYYLKLRTQFNPKFFTQLGGHAFFAQATPAEFVSGNLQELDPYLGTELDFSLGYLFHPAFSLQFGYSQMFASDTFEALSGTGTEFDERQNWAYLMFIFRPTMKNKNIGILF